MPAVGCAIRGWGLLCRVGAVLYNTLNGCQKLLSQKNLGLSPFSLAPHRAVSSGTNSGVSQRLLSAAVTAELGAKGYRTEMSQSIKGWGRPPHPRQAGRTWWPTALGAGLAWVPLDGRSPESSLKVPRGSPKVKHTLTEQLMNCSRPWGSSSLSARSYSAGRSERLHLAKRVLMWCSGRASMMKMTKKLCPAIMSHTCERPSR